MVEEEASPEEPKDEVHIEGDGLNEDDLGSCCSGGFLNEVHIEINLKG